MHNPTVVHHRAVRRPHGAHARIFSWLPPALRVHCTQKDTPAIGLAAKPQRASPPREVEFAPASAAKFVICDHTIELVNWELKSGLGLGQHQVSGDEKRSTNSVGIAVLAYLFLLRAGHHDVTPGQSWSIFQLQHVFQLRAMTNQVEHNVKAKMAKGRKAA